MGLPRIPAKCHSDFRFFSFTTEESCLFCRFFKGKADGNLDTFRFAKNSMTDWFEKRLLDDHTPQPRRVILISASLVLPLKNLICFADSSRVKRKTQSK